MSTPRLPVASRTLRLLLLIGFFFMGMLIASVVTMLIMHGEDGTLNLTRSGVLISSAVQNIVAFIAPVVLLAWLVSAKPWKELYISNFPRWKAVVGVLLIYVVSIPAMTWITSANEAITFPDCLSWLETWLRSMEDQAAASTQILLEVNTVGGLIINILIIGVLTGVGEEMFFRAGVQNFIHRGTSPIKPWIAVWVTAVVFSAMHFQFYGFLPRMLLGAYFGYLLVWTRSLWVPILAHAINNSVAVWEGYAIYNNQITEQSLSFGEPGSDTEWMAAVSTVLLIVIFTVGRKALFQPFSE